MAKPREESEKQANGGRRYILGQDLGIRVSYGQLEASNSSFH